MNNQKSKFDATSAKIDIVHGVKNFKNSQGFQLVNEKHLTLEKTLC